MKNIIISLALIGLVSTGHADSTVYDLAQAHCQTAQLIAETAQSFRQSGMNPSQVTDKLMAVASTTSDPELKQQTNKMIFMIVQDAYTVPLQPSQELKKQAVTDYSEKNYLACLNAFQKKIDTMK